MTILSTIKEIMRRNRVYLGVFVTILLLFAALLFFSLQMGIEEEAFQYFVF